MPATRSKGIRELIKRRKSILHCLGDSLTYFVILAICVPVLVCHSEYWKQELLGVVDRCHEAASHKRTCSASQAAAFEAQHLRCICTETLVTGLSSRNAPARMEGDPSARITPWSSEGEGESHDKAAMHNSNPAINVPSRDSNSLASAAGKDGMQESSQASADWGDAGDFSLGPLDTLAFAASEQSQEAQQQDQQHHSNR